MIVDCIKMDTCVLEENVPKRITSHATTTIHTEEIGVQTYFPKAVKTFRTVATQTDNNIAINILNSKRYTPKT